MTRPRHPKPALVTGATGFVGRALVRRLAEQGRVVHVLTRPGSKTAGLPPACRIHRSTGRRDELLQIMRGVRPGTVFHLASLPPSAHEPGLTDRMLEANVTLGARLAETAAATGVRRFVNAGSFWQRRSGREYDPVDLYAASKQALQVILEYYARATSLRVMNLILFDTYGPRDPRPKLLNSLRRSLRSGKTLDLSPGRQRLYMVHVEDVVSAFLRAERLLEGSAAPRPARSYAVRTPTAVTVRQLVRACAKAWGGEPPVRFGARPYRAREVMTAWPGPMLPGWRPRVSLDGGLRELLADPA